MEVMELYCHESLALRYLGTVIFSNDVLRIFIALGYK